LHQKESAWAEIVTQYNYIYTTAINSKNVVRSDEALDSAYFYAINKLNRDSSAYFYTLANLGYDEYAKNNFTQAIDFLTEAIHGLDSLNTPLLHYASNFRTLFASYRQKGENSKAISLADYYINKARNLGPTLKQREIDFLFQKALSQRDNGEYNNAIESTKKAITESKYLPSKSKRQSNNYNYTRSLAKTYLESGQPDSALYYINRSSEIRKTQNKKLNYFSHHEKAKIHFEMEDYKSCAQELKNALSTYKKRKLVKQKILATLNSTLGFTFLKLNQLDSAGFYLALAEKQLDVPLDKKYTNYNDYLTNSDFNLANVNILSQIAEFELAKYRQKNDFEARDRAIIRYDQAFRGTKFLYKELSNNTDKFRLNANLQKYLSNYLTLLLEIYSNSKEDEIIAKIFQLIEDNKSIVLKEDILQKKLLSQLDLPEDVASKESNLRQSINDLQRKIYKHKSKTDSDTKLIEEWTETLTEEKVEFDRFQKNLKKEYPDYYKRSFSISYSDLSLLQQELKRDECYINFFNTKESLMYVWITNKKYGIEILSQKDQIFDQVNTYISTIRNKPDGDFTQADLNKFKKRGHDLYSHLIHKELRNKKSIIVSPYALLHYLPFETLLTDFDNSQISFKSLPYLIKGTDVEYAYSSDIFLLSRAEQNIENEIDVVSYAPFISEHVDKRIKESTNRDALTILRCSDDEIDAITNIFNNKTLKSKEATTQAFKNNPDYDIIHLATHGSVDDENSNFNKLHFADDYLAVQDISQLQLNASLVVLSACKTGLGNLKSGEGVINLGREFRKAGVPSIVHSLWSLDDCVTSEIITMFYEKLTSSDISGALRQAKTDYIDSANKLKAHPYYWAGLVFSGNTAAFTPEKSLGSKTIMTIGLIISLLFILLLISRKNQIKD